MTAYPELTGPEYQDDEYQQAWGEYMIALATDDADAQARAAAKVEALKNKRAGRKDGAK